MSQTIRTKAIVLRRTNYGEADRIIQIITPDSGRLSVMARGVRREKSRLAGGIELFAVCDLVLTRGTKSTSDLWTLTGARLGTFFDRSCLITIDYNLATKPSNKPRELPKRSMSQSFIICSRRHFPR